MAGLPGPGPSDADAPAGARPAADELPVTVLYSRRVKAGREADFEAWVKGQQRVAEIDARLVAIRQSESVKS